MLLPQKTAEKRLLTSFETWVSLDSPQPGKKKKRNEVYLYTYTSVASKKWSKVCLLYLLPFYLSRLCCPILKLFHILFPDGVEDPIIVASVTTSRCLAVHLATVKQHFRKRFSTSVPCKLYDKGADDLLIRLIRAGLIPRLLWLPPLVSVNQLCQIGRLFGMPYDILVF